LESVRTRGRAVEATGPWRGGVRRWSREF
jgi:hypothetical protein